MGENAVYDVGQSVGLRIEGEKPGPAATRALLVDPDLKRDGHKVSAAASQRTKNPSPYRLLQVRRDTFMEYLRRRLAPLTR
jgi:hypothetical protein